MAAFDDIALETIHERYGYPDEHRVVQVKCGTETILAFGCNQAGVSQ